MKKKILALLLSGVLTLSMLSTAFAIETHNVLTVTVSGNTATVNGTYEGLKPGNYPVAVNSSTASLGVVNVTVNADGSISGEGTIDSTDVDASDLTVLTSIPMSEGSESVTLTNKDSEPATEYTVTFDLNGGTSEAIPAQTVEEGKTATKPADPTWADHTFEGWFTNKEHAEGETQFDFTTAITGNITLYAHWTENGGGDVAVTSVALNKTSLSLVEGTSETLTATVTVTPDVDANKKVAWQSSDSTIATVKDGVVTGVKAGTATITATSIADGTKSASCTVTVTAKSSGGNTGDNQGSSSGSSSNGTSGSSSPAIKPLPDRNHGTTTPANPSENPGTETPAFFNDVPANYWAAGAIEWVNENGFMNGINETTFNPEGNITRQQMWMIMSRMAGSSAADMAAARTWAMGRNLTDGTNPAGSMTRQQLVTFLYRFAQRQGFTLSGSSPLTTFSDHANVAGYAQTPLSWAVANGIIAGKNDGRLDPTGTATRAQFATILQRFYTNIVNKNA